MRGRRITPVLALLLWLAVGAVPADTAQVERDEEFVAGMAAERGSLDRAALAAWLDNLASRLAGGRRGVAALRDVVDPRDPQRVEMQRRLDDGLAAYSAALAEFGEAATALRERPDSPRRLFRALARGHRTCWALRTFRRQAETYGATVQELLETVSSSEACRLFRAAAFLPQVEAAIEAGFSTPQELLEQNRALAEDLAAAERLIEDLGRIDAP